MTRWQTNLHAESQTPVQTSRPPKSFKPYPFQYHQELELKIEGLTNLGMGVGRVNVKPSKKHPKGFQGFVVMVPNVIPGETVRVRVLRNAKKHAEADLVEVLDPREDIRVQPQCPYFSKCGGCQYQHMTVDAQREWKRQQVEYVMHRIGGIQDINVSPTIGSEHHFGYRSKITPHVDAPDSMEELGRACIGFQRRGTLSHLGVANLIDVECCKIATDAINQKYSTTRDHLRGQWEEGKLSKKGATLLFRDCEEGVATDSGVTISQKVGDKLFRFKAGEFFQNNAYVLPLMVEHVIRLATGDGCTHLIDTYCGSGLFGISGANYFTHVSGVEVSELAVEAARSNALLNNVTNADFLCAPAEAIFSRLDSNVFRKESTAVIIDPPRKGCDAAFLEQLFEFSPRKLLYVSCDPATQARDAAQIIAHGYQITHCTPFDLFPQTRHIENVMVFLNVQ